MHPTANHEVLYGRFSAVCLDPEISPFVPPHKAFAVSFKMHESAEGRAHACSHLNWMVLQVSEDPFRPLQAQFPPKRCLWTPARAENCLSASWHVACHAAPQWGQLIAAIGSDIYIDNLRIDAHGLACAQHAAYTAPETPRNGGFGRPPPLGFCQSDWPRARA